MFATKWAKFGAGTLAAATLGTTGIVTVDRAQNPYQDKDTHYELPIKADFEQGERVEIAKDKAQMTLKGWNDEYAITITPQIPTASFGAIEKPFNVVADRKLLSKKLEYRTGDVTAFIEPRDKANEFDIDFTLAAKPDTNVFTYKIDGAEEFDFFYQPPLTEEEIAEGAERPENVVGSYAVYHKTKANHRVGSTNYATGKAFHIYRPKAIDANGAEVWAELVYHDGVLSVTVPQMFLDDAAYPVTVDPTFGNTNCGTSAADIAGKQFNNSNRVGRGITSSSGSATLDKLTACLDMTSTSETVDISVFLNVENTVTDSHTQVAAIERLNLSLSTTNTFYDFTASGEAISSIDYILSASGDQTDIAAGSPEGARLLFDSSASCCRNYSEPKSAYSDTKETPWTETDATGSNNYSIYATYTASGGGGGTASEPEYSIIFQ